jgi:prophage tail gpP-like protein
MSNPAPRSIYTVTSGDTLSSIAQRAYGDGTKWPVIRSANLFSKKSIDPEIIFPGEVLFIPADIEIEKAYIESIKAAMRNKKDDELTVIIENTEIKPLSARIIKSMDNGIFSWAANIDWEPGDNTVLDQNLLPFKYPRASIFIGDVLAVNGFLYGSNPSFTQRGRIVTLFGYSPMADVANSAIRPPYEENNVTLEGRIKSVLAPFGMSLEVKDGLDTGGQFRRVTAAIREKAFKHLSELAAQRGVLFTSTPEGAALLTIADAESKSVGTISEGKQGSLGFAGKFDGRTVFFTYKATGQSPGFFSKSAIAKNINIPRSRFMTFVSDDTISGEMQKVADWKRSKQFAEAMGTAIPYDGWYAPNGELWRENTKVTLESKTLHLPNGFDFIIRSAEFTLDNTGRKTLLNLVPPQVYTGEDIGYPWSN